MTEGANSAVQPGDMKVARRNFPVFQVPVEKNQPLLEVILSQQSWKAVFDYRESLRATSQCHDGRPPNPNL